ncbi:cytochrome P450 [Mycena galopus ATCC 62051]|nr:cytochrome P450 [Mycena galopus ATCC 62051]
MSSFLSFLPSRVTSALLAILKYYAVFRILNWSFNQFHSTPSALQRIPGPPPQSWFAGTHVDDTNLNQPGNLGQLFNAKGLPFHQKLVDLYGGMVKVYGFFGDEQLYISDPRAMQSILVKEQDAYEETAVFVETNRVIFGPGLVSTTGDIHKRQRKLVNPIFSPSNLRELVPAFQSVAERLTDVLMTECRAGGGGSRVDMSEWMSRAALEAVGQTVLGYSFDPLDSPVNNPYTHAIRELIPTIFSLSLIRQFAPFLVRLGPAWIRRRLVEWTPNKAVQKVKRMSDVMHQTAVDILEDRREGLRREEGGVLGARAKDIISLLLRANQIASTKEQLSEAELTGQMTVMIFGAQDTSSSALSRIMYMLSLRPDIQQNIRREIRAAQTSDHPLNLDEVSSFPWLDAVLKETLRLYPPVPFVRRTALEERTIPFTTLSGDMSSVIIPRGTTLFLGIAGANRLKSVWGSDAEEWKPERWLEGDFHKADPSLRLPGIYSGMMSFLGGQRSCIGYKFAQIEIKILLIALISRFEVSSTKDEIVWNLSQIISPSVRTVTGPGAIAREEKGLPLYIRPIEEDDFGGQQADL